MQNLLVSCLRRLVSETARSLVHNYSHLFLIQCSDSDRTTQVRVHVLVIALLSQKLSADHC